MYGKSYESMYSGSLIGAGMNVFAVWNYIITMARGGCIEVNPKLLAFTLGGSQDDVESALMFLQRPDPISRSKAEDGRRIVKEGQFQYRVVNWELYQSIKSAEELREYNCRKQAEYRARKYNPVKGEEAAMKAVANGDDDLAASIQEASLPEKCR